MPSGGVFTPESSDPGPNQGSDLRYTDQNHLGLVSHDKSVRNIVTITSFPAQALSASTRFTTTETCNKGPEIFHCRNYGLNLVTGWFVSPLESPRLMGWASQVSGMLAAVLNISHPPNTFSILLIYYLFVMLAVAFSPQSVDRRTKDKVDTLLCLYADDSILASLGYTSLAQLGYRHS